MLSAGISLSVSTTCAAFFKSTTGFSVGGYITNYRIRQACALLRKGASVQEAGEQVGFGNNANFIRTFKRIIGITPGKV